MKIAVKITPAHPDMELEGLADYVVVGETFEQCVAEASTVLRTLAAKRYCGVTEAEADKIGAIGSAKVIGPVLELTLDEED